MTEQNRHAGDHASSLARAAAVQVAGSIIVILGAFALAGIGVTSHSKIDVGVGVAVAAVAWYLMVTARTKFSKASVGARSERRVAQEINRQNPVGLGNSLLLGAGGDADHVVVGPWLVAVETKTGHGHVVASGQTLRAGKRTIPGDPVAQSKRQAAAVGRVAGTYCDAVVCIPDMTNAPFVDRGVTVCSLRDLGQVLRSTPARLDRTHAARLFSHLQEIDNANRAK